MSSIVNKVDILSGEFGSSFGRMKEHTTKPWIKQPIKNPKKSYLPYVPGISSSESGLMNLDLEWPCT